MSEKIINRLDELEQELITLEKSLVEKRSNISNQNQESSSANSSLQQELKKEKVKNQKASDIISKNIIKIARIIEKEEKNNA